MFGLRRPGGLAFGLSLRSGSGSECPPDATAHSDRSLHHGPPQQAPTPDVFGGPWMFVVELSPRHN
ncbi:MAG: hypothetical protein JO020_32880 [Chloroflexi bacterium]|nr:hypothetical protein [Chloroflexota bacterium]MBV9898977.1 hypothetical protein [Chloroflexota bacterium]